MKLTTNELQNRIDKSKEGDCMKHDKEKLIEFIDDTVDIGKEPLTISDPELEKQCNQIMDKYK